MGPFCVHSLMKSQLKANSTWVLTIVTTCIGALVETVGDLFYLRAFVRTLARLILYKAL